MKKNLLGKLILIVALVAISAWELYPPSKTLKPGLDLAGGTSLIYDIDTQGLSPEETKGLSQRMIPILSKRIDPTNVANIVMRPHGSTRLEIQVPLASADTRQRRNGYEQALGDLEAENINLAMVMKSLSNNTEQREKDFVVFARGSQSRKQILDSLAEAYDKLQTLQQEESNYGKQLAAAEEKNKQSGLNVEDLKASAPQWIQLTQQDREGQIDAFVKDKKDSKPAIEAYLEIYEKWSATANQLAEPETGVRATYKKALSSLEELNLNTDQINDVLEMRADSKQRAEFIEQFKVKFADRLDKIDKLIAAFSEYSPVRGRLDDPEDVRRMLKGAGVLEFRILPIPGDSKFTVDEATGYMEALKTQGPKRASDIKYVWCPIEDIKEWKQTNGVVGAFADKYYVLTSNLQNEVMIHGAGTKEWRLKRAYPTTDEVGRRAIGFTFDEIASKLFYIITSKNIDRPLCILLDGAAISAPKINSAISGRGIIQGSFTAIEVDDMVNKLNAGSLPARLIEPPVSYKTIGPSIGADNRDKGIKAGLIGLAAVAVFMVIYYVGSGSIADVALFMNLLFLLAIMALSRATFTLPGIAGVILTIGMAVDANVLINERIREEQQRGCSLRIAIENGYHRAFTTIFDSNLTTFITALILYFVASEEIKGFAVTLMLGIISSMFTALFVTKAIFDFLLDKKIIKNHLLMLRIIGVPKFDWMKARPVFLTISIILVTLGLGVFFLRDDTKNNKYDIEFTGGTSVQINLKEGAGLTRADVESRINKAGVEMNNPAIAAAIVYKVGTTGTQYEINTTETNKNAISVTFPKAEGYNVGSVTSSIQTAQEKAAGTLANLMVSQDKQNPAKFDITTSQMNKTLVTEILDSAFAKDNAVISEPVVDEVVDSAIKNAFGDLLQIQKNLEPAIASASKLTDADIQAHPELVDFTGGIKILCELKESVAASELDARFKDLRFKPDMQDLEWGRYVILGKGLEKTQPGDSVNSFVYIGTAPDSGLRQLSEDEWTQFIENEKTKITTATSLETSLPSITQIDPSIGNQAKIRALIAILLSFLAMVAYLWVRFGTARYGIAAIVALLHDVCISLGAITACTYFASTPWGEKLLIGDFKINLTVIAAFLTIVGYSVNDTIVIFDRIRENRGKLSSLSPQLITDSINQTMSRTILTSFTTWIVVFVMYVWGGPALRGFNFAMLVGLLAGTYSTVAIAAPILLLGLGKKQKTK